MDATRWVAEFLGGPGQIFQPAYAFLLLDRDAGRVDDALTCVRALKPLSSPKLDGRQTKRQAIYCDCQTGVQEQTTRGVGLVPPLNERQPANVVRRIARKAKLGGVVQHEGCGVGRRETAGSGGHMAG